MRHFKNKRLKTTLLCVSSLGLAAAGTPAFAGGCGLGVSPALCQTGISVNPGTGPVFDNMTVNVQQPMGHLRSINFQRAPNTSITRVHGMMDSAALSDFPSRFTGGCNPTSTAYCREETGVPVNVQFNAPPAQPVMQMPVMPARIMMPAPVMQPAAPRVVAIGGGYDPSKFIPRQYGENTFTPGTVYASTSFINRDPAAAARVLAENGYSTGSYGSMTLSGPMPSAAISAPAPAASAMNMIASGNLLAGAPTAGVPHGANYLGSVVTGTTTSGPSTPSGNVVGGVDGSGGYWEKVSGLTMFGDTVATSVVCRRQAPQKTSQIVSPVYGVPQPVPTAVPYFVDVPYKVRGNVIPQGCRRVDQPFIAPPLSGPVMPRNVMPQPRPALMPGVLPYGPTMGGPTMSGPRFGPPMTAGWTY